jgi:predicted small secreted protein
MTGLQHVRGRFAGGACTLALVGAMTLLVACNTVSGAGKDIGATGNAITGGAEKTKRALPPAPGPTQ